MRTIPRTVHMLISLPRVGAGQVAGVQINVGNAKIPAIYVHVRQRAADISGPVRPWSPEIVRN